MFRMIAIIGGRKDTYGKIYRIFTLILIKDNTKKQTFLSYIYIYIYVYVYMLAISRNVSELQNSIFNGTACWYLYIITLLYTVKTCYETCPVFGAFIFASVNRLSLSISYHESYCTASFRNSKVLNSNYGCCTEINRIIYPLRYLTCLLQLPTSVTTTLTTHRYQDYFRPLPSVN